MACQEGTLTRNGSVSLAFAEDVGVTSVDRWNLTFGSKSVTLGAINGTVFLFR